MKKYLLLLLVICGCKKEEICPTCVVTEIVYPVGTPGAIMAIQKDTVITCERLTYETRDTLVFGEWFVIEKKIQCK